MKKFIVYFEDCECRKGDFENMLVIVNANNKEEAINKFLTNYVINQENFTQDILFFNKFNDDLFEEGTGKLYSKYTDEIATNIIKDRIREFFKGTDFADIYINANFNCDDNVTLPTELLVYYLKNDRDYSGVIIAKNINDIIIK